MKRSKRDRRVSSSLFSLRIYLLFFLTISALVSCCLLLFLGTLQTVLGITLEEQHIQQAAKYTFGNVVFLSLVCAVFDGIRRKITVERPVHRILEATHQLTHGDFSARIRPFHGFDSMNEFDAIIEDFNKMAEELSGTETLRTDFIANVSHELKTPLAVIQNYATMLQSPDLPEDRRTEYAIAITDATRRLSALITNILKLNRLENQQIYPQWSFYELNEQLCECLLYFEDAWEQKNLQIETELDELVTIRGDEELLSLVWNNLFSNAVKFTGAGGTVKVRLTAEEGRAVVTVSDTGCGISPEAGRHIFEKFYQGDSSHATQGNGLGLALVKRVVDIMGGEISVDSVVGQGSTFTVRLPREAL